jgi:hypothetical protein
MSFFDDLTTITGVDTFSNLGETSIGGVLDNVISSKITKAITTPAITTTTVSGANNSSTVSKVSSLASDNSKIIYAVGALVVVIGIFFAFKGKK